MRYKVSLGIAFLTFIKADNLWVLFLYEPYHGKMGFNAFLSSMAPSELLNTPGPITVALFLTTDLRYPSLKILFLIVLSRLFPLYKRKPLSLFRFNSRAYLNGIRNSESGFPYFPAKKSDLKRLKIRSSQSLYLNRERYYSLDIRKFD